MEDMLMHMMGGVGFGDVLISIPDLKHGFVIKETSSSPAQGCVPDATLEFLTGGTGFMIHIFPDLMVENYYVLGIALSALHVVCSLDDFQPKDFPFRAYSEKGEKLDLWFIKHYAETFTDECISPTFGNRYCLPGDVAVLLVTSLNRIKLGHYNIANECQVNDFCFISGYPKRPDDIFYCSPQHSSIPNFRNVIKRAFNNFEGLVYSSGRVNNRNNEVIEIDCSTTNGMSGSPIVRNEEIIGIYVGGPPIIGQRELFQIYRKLNSELILDAFNQLKSLKLYHQYFSRNTFVILKTDFKQFLAVNAIMKKEPPHKSCLMFYKNFCKLNLDDTEIEVFNDKLKKELSSKIMHTIYSLVMNYKKPEEYTYNIGLSVSHDLFDDVRNTLKKASTNLNFSSIGNILNSLK